MKTQPPEWHRLEAGVLMTAPELARCCQLRVDELQELVEYGALEHAGGEGDVLLFASDCLAPLRVASRLRLDFDLDLFTMGLLLGYLRRIDALERQLASLRARLPAHVAQVHHEPARWREEHARAQDGTPCRH
jgi:chaperone modulatory protein CbpM